MAGEKIKIQLLAEVGTLSELTALCAPLGIEHCTESPLALVRTETHLALRKLDEPKLGDVFVDFVAGAMAHRRKPPLTAIQITILYKYPDHFLNHRFRYFMDIKKHALSVLLLFIRVFS